MILPVVAYGHPVLRQVCEDIQSDYPNLDVLIANMWETMYHSHGMGIAAPQINKAIRLFVIDTEQVYNNSDEDERVQFEGEQGLKKVFINAHITERTGKEWTCDEGCLSLPGFREEVTRENIITISYCDENFVQKVETFRGLNARVIQHEYDHIEGVLFTDKLSPLKKKIIKGKLTKITSGDIHVGYKMRFPK